MKAITKKFPIILTKRQKIVIAGVLITIGLILSTQTVSFVYVRYRLIVALAIISYILSLWALWEGMTRFKAVILMILPTLFTVGVTSFYFLLEVRWLTRLPVAVIFGLSFYSLLLSQNVFNVAAQRTIPLYRAASTVAFLFTLITAFFIFNVIFALRMPFYLNGLFVFVISFLLIIQFLWTIEMSKISSGILVCSFSLALLVGEVAVALSFWPVAPTIWSLTLAALIYVLLGIITQYIKERLNKRLLAEYMGVGGLVLLFALFTTSWVGR